MMGMRPMDPDEQWCFDRLVQWEARFDALMSMYEGPRGRIPPDRVEQARDLYKTLKQDLREEYKRLSNSRLERNASEDRWYTHTIHQAYAHLRAPTNTSPEHWHDHLYESRIDITHSLAQMRSSFGLVKGE